MSLVNRDILILSAIIAIIIVDSAYGQQTTDIRIPDSTTTQILTLQDGSELLGRVTNVTDSIVTFESALGSTKIARNRIKEIREIPQSSMKKGVYWFANPNATRLFFSPTGRMLKKGEGYFSDYYIFFPGISYGLTDNITLGGGLSAFPGLGLSKQIYFFTPKIGLSATKNSSLALGALILSIPHKVDDEKIPTIGILYGVGTYGNSNSNLTGGLGFGFVNSRIAHNPAVMIGGEKRFSRGISFLSENWIFPNVDQPIISYGIRFFGEKLSADLGFFSILGKDFFFPGIPWVDFVYKFR